MLSLLGKGEEIYCPGLQLRLPTVPRLKLGVSQEHEVKAIEI